MIEFDGDAIAQREQDKYLTMWADPDYRKISPGEPLVAEAIATMGMDAGRGDSVIDFGCGTGRPAVAFAQAGFTVICVDLTEKCLDPEVDEVQDLDFIEATLWNLPPRSELFADWGFCTDVMEHLPPAKVEQALRELRRVTWRGVFFQIACFPDNRARHGLELHLTIRDPGWWRDLLQLVWPAVVMRPNGQRPQFWCMTGETNRFAELED